MEVNRKDAATILAPNPAMSEQTHHQDPNDPEGQFVNIDLLYDADTNVLSAVVEDGDTPLVVDLSYLKNLIEHHEFQDLFFAQDALQDVLSQIKQGARGSFAIGERRDASITIAIADDAMSAAACIEPAYGGAPLDNAKVEHALNEAGVDRARWDHDGLRELIAQGSAGDYEIASGVAPEHGIDCKFTSLVEGIIRHPPTELELGNVDQYDVHDYTVVEPGTLLMRRQPATEGVDGMDVRGRRLSATPGKDAAYAKDMPGAVLDDTDPNLLIACTKGHPVVLSNGVRLDEVLKLSAADMRTGHVVFDGSLYVTGDVSAGVFLQATGDVVVKGTVDDAIIQAGADIVVGGGVINSEPQVDGKPLSIRLEAGGSIQAKFVSGAHLQAEHNVTVKEYIGFCHTEAREQVLVGQSGGKGRIYGGSCHGYNGVLANQLGSNASGATLVSAGFTAAPSEDQTELNEALAQLEEQCKKVQFLLENMSCGLTPTPTANAEEDNPSDPPDEETCNKLFNTLSDLENQQENIRGSLAELQAHTDACAETSISASKVIRAGVSLRINGVQRNFKNRDAGGTFKLRNGAVVRVE